MPIVVDKLEALGVLDDTAILISSDHGEAFGELGVYADHQGADEATCHIPAILRWPGLAPRSYAGLQYHLDMAATVLDLADIEVPTDWWRGESVAPALRSGNESGRDALFLSQGAWSCQRGVRFGDHLYLNTRHDGFHAHWNDDMLFDIANDPHETNDLAEAEPGLVSSASTMLDNWIDEQVAQGLGEPAGRVDPMDTVLAEGDPYQCQGHLPAYLERLRTTDRGHWADVLADRHQA